jgi:hypothetical protein
MYARFTTEYTSIIEHKLPFSFTASYCLLLKLNFPKMDGTSHSKTLAYESLLTNQ